MRRAITWLRPASCSSTYFKRSSLTAMVEARIDSVHAISYDARDELEAASAGDISRYFSCPPRDRQEYRDLQSDTNCPSRMACHRTRRDCRTLTARAATNSR